MEGRLLLNYVRPGTTEEIPVGFAADTLVCFVRSKPIDSGDSRLSKHISRVFSEVANRTESLKLLIYGQSLVNGPRTLLAELDLMVEDQQKKRLKGTKYFVLELRDETVTDLWEVSRLLIEGEPGSGRR